MITVRIKEDGVEKVIANVNATVERVRQALGAGLSIGLQLAAGVAQVDYLSGPRPGVLDVVTTRLRNSIVTEVEDDGNVISGRIGTNIPYAAFHEFGFHGVEHVGSFTRVTHRVNGLGHVLHGGKKAAKRQKAGFAGVTFVRAHDRKIDYDGRPYIRPALAGVDIGGKMTTELKKISNG